VVQRGCNQSGVVTLEQGSQRQQGPARLRRFDRLDDRGPARGLRRTRLIHRAGEQERPALPGDPGDVGFGAGRNQEQDLASREQLLQPTTRRQVERDHRLGVRYIPSRQLQVRQAGLRDGFVVVPIHRPDCSRGRIEQLDHFTQGADSSLP
jgi:hypothetical protein